MLNEPRQHVTTYPGTVQVVTTPGASGNVLDWPLVLWNIQRRLQHPQNFNVANKFDEFGQFCPA